MRTRVLFVNEFSCHNSGYAKYGMEVLSRLAEKKDIQIAELACYGSESNKSDVEKANNLPWDVFFNTPDLTNPKYAEIYNAKRTNQYGEFSFNKVLLRFKPHVVMDIRDFWMGAFIEESPFRDMYNRVIMAPVDSFPQVEEWIYSYSRADGVFTYTDWGKSILEKQAGKNINLLGTASPAASDDYKPQDKKTAKNNFGLSPDSKIVGTIMRNQSRKLFPDLFASFRQYLDKSGRPDVFLYCHTAYPDSAWDIPELLKHYEVASKVLFTYRCTQCGFVFPNYYQGITISCPKCGKFSASHPTVENGVSEQELANIVACFDLYVQYMGLEGLGMPVVEAGMAGIPLVGVNHTSMVDVLPKTGGDGIDPIAVHTEPHSLRQWGVPNNGGFVDYLIDFFSAPLPNRSIKGKNTRELTKQNYNWDDTANKWYEYFKTVDIDKYEKSWYTPSRLRNPAKVTEQQMKMNSSDYVRWLIENVLCDKSKLHSYFHMRLLKDVNNQRTVVKPYMRYTREMAYNECANMCNEFNLWEKERLK